MKGLIWLCWLRHICCLNMQPHTLDKVFFQCSRSLFKIKAVTLCPALTDTCTHVCMSLWWSRSGLHPAMRWLHSGRSAYLKHVSGFVFTMYNSNISTRLFKAAWKIKAISPCPQAPGQLLLSKVAPYAKATQALPPTPDPMITMGLPEF